MPPSRKPPPADDAPIAALQDAIRHLHGVESTWAEKRQSAAGYTPGPYVRPKIQELPPSMLAHSVEVRSNEAYTPAYGADSEIKLVELRNLIAIQYWMDTDVSEGVHGACAEDVPTEEEVLDRCLPKTIVSPAKLFTVPIRNGVAVYSPNNTLSARGPILTPEKMAKGEITFILATNPNLMLVREVNNRLLLLNGYHRAWWLLSKKIEMAPVVLAKVRSQNDLAGENGAIDLGHAMQPRPPIVGDFFDDNLSSTIEVRAMLRCAKVSAEVLPTPRLI